MKICRAVWWNLTYLREREFAYSACCFQETKQWNDSFEGSFLCHEDIYNSLEYKGLHNVELVKGDIAETLDTYLEGNPHLRISFLHIDTDV